jgi:hypothetical protein
MRFVFHNASTMFQFVVTHSSFGSIDWGRLGFQSPPQKIEAARAVDGTERSFTPT